MRRLLILALVSSVLVAHAQTILPVVGSTFAGAVATTARNFSGVAGDHLDNSIAYLNGTGAFTVTFWFKSGSTSQTNTYVAEFGDTGSQVSIIYGYAPAGTPKQIELYTGGVGVWRTGSQITIPDTGWHHIAYRYDGVNEWAYFLDGVKTIISSTFGVTTLPTHPALATLGNANAGGAPINASLARLMVVTTNLTDAQITALAGTCSSSGISGTNVAGYWLLGQASPDPESSPSTHTNSFTVTGTTSPSGPPCTSQ